MRRLSFGLGSLRMKLMLGGCLMAIIPVIVLGSIAVYNAKTNIEKETDQQILMISKSIADMVDSVMVLEGNLLKSFQQKPRPDLPGGTFTAVLDLAHGSVSSPKRHAEVRFPAWVLSEDQVVPLQELLKALAPLASPTVPKPPAPGP